MKTVTINSPVKGILYMTIGTICFKLWLFAFKFVVIFLFLITR